MTTTTAPILILAAGNESRGDDALAPLLLRRLQEWVADEGLDERVELLEEFQLQVEHVADMNGRRLVLFVDAGADMPAPYTFYRARASNAPALFSHALTPEALFSVYVQVYRETPPPIFVLCIRGERFDLGTGLSPEAEIRLETALDFTRGLLRETEAAAWEKRIGK